MSNLNIKYGWKRDKKDPRDLKFVPMKQGLDSLPKSVDLRDKFPEPYDQGALGSCGANALSGLSEYVMRESRFTPSRLALYYETRVIENTVEEDSGVSLRDMMQVGANYGLPHESLWWYNVAKFDVKPSHLVAADASKHKITKYLSLDNTKILDLKKALAQGNPFVFGFDVYPDLESDAVAKSGILPMPKAKEQSIGGHAVCAVGYNDTKKVFIVRNSWGTSWGLKGYFLMPYAYLTSPDFAADCWTIEAIA